MDARTDVVRRFYEEAPFPGYPPRDSLSALRLRAERSAFAALLDRAIAGDAAYNDVTSPDHPLRAVRVDFANGLNAGGGLIYSLRSLNDTESLHAVPGFDDVTGNGTPKGANFIALLNRAG